MLIPRILAHRMDTGRAESCSPDTDSTVSPPRLMSDDTAPRGTPKSSEVELSFYAKFFVFLLFTQLAQMMMSYDGGATQMSTQSLLKNGWTSSELGWLGAMDKFGQVATAFLWSRLLAKYNVKCLLSLGLVSKAVSCLGFGILRAKWAMLASKLGMGVSEALIGVWATVWVQSNAPRDRVALWSGFAGISAGMGNGMGSFIAGFFNKKYGYTFAFVLQASILFTLWGILVFCPGRWFNYANAAKARAKETGFAKPDFIMGQDSDDEMCMHRSHGGRAHRSYSGDLSMFLREELASEMVAEISGSRRSHHHGHRWLPEGAIPEDDVLDNELSAWATLNIVMTNPLWLATAMGISLTAFVTSAVAYMWQNTTMSVWRFTEEEATISFLVTTGIGGFVGVSLGPRLFDRIGFDSAAGVHSCLVWCTRLTMCAVVMGSINAALFLDTAYHMVHKEVTHQAPGFILGVVMAATFIIFSLVNSMQGTLYGINTASASDDFKTSAAGLTVAMQNIIGFAMGPLVPSIVAQMVGDGIQAWTPETEMSVVRPAQFSTGMAISLLVLFLLLFSLRKGADAAVEAVERERPSSPLRRHGLSPISTAKMVFFDNSEPLEFLPL